MITGNKKAPLRGTFGFLGMELAALVEFEP